MKWWGYQLKRTIYATLNGSWERLCKCFVDFPDTLYPFVRNKHFFQIWKGRFHVQLNYVCHNNTQHISLEFSPAVYLVTSTIVGQERNSTCWPPGKVTGSSGLARLLWGQIIQANIHYNGKHWHLSFKSEYFHLNFSTVVTFHFQYP